MKSLNKRSKAALSVVLAAAAVDVIRDFSWAKKVGGLLEEKEEKDSLIPALNVEQFEYPPRINDIAVMCVMDLDNKVYGPLSKNEVRECVADGRIDSNSRVCFRLGKTLKGKERYSDWVDFSSTGWKEMCRPERKPISQFTPLGCGKPQYNIRFWLLDDAEQDHGPFTTAAIPKLLAEGILHQKTLVYVEGGPWEWLPVYNHGPISSQMGRNLICDHA